ncbi:unnamed protein product [Protopolystoma xenopodis]|uniref:Uncharacterized protein n=1 Tax=Protopolystoma xenopodis TaxID=117903 RepID=A0A3S5A2R9_9PLAT|nr:unnamed protein product [Protopolystoma xenopodis]
MHPHVEPDCSPFVGVTFSGKPALLLKMATEPDDWARPAFVTSTAEPASRALNLQCSIPGLACLRLPPSGAPYKWKAKMAFDSVRPSKRFSLQFVWNSRLKDTD